MKSLNLFALRYAPPEDWQGALIASKYGNGRLALHIKDAVTGEPIAKCTVNLPDEPVPNNTSVFLKDYSENEGMYELFLNAGLIHSIFYDDGKGTIGIKLNVDVLREYLSDVGMEECVKNAKC